MMGVQSRCSMGQTVMGGGHSHLEECSWSTCPSQEDFCPDRVWYWGVVARKSERVYAWGWKGRKEVCRGERWLSPWGTCKITVVVDGGWSKRPHIVKHSYIAKSGVAVIIGQQTGKLWHIGVPHRYCSARAQEIPRDQHQRYKIWDASSSGMEMDIILEGFMQAEQVHGVRYMRFIRDGDSSMHTTLLGICYQKDWVC